jgi:glycerol kinase
LGSALLAGSTIKLFGWDINKQDTFVEVNNNGSREFAPGISEEESLKRFRGWQRAVERSRGWEGETEEETNTRN